MSMDIESEDKKGRKTFFVGEHQIKFRRDYMEIVESVRNGQCKAIRLLHNIFRRFEL